MNAAASPVLPRKQTRQRLDLERLMNEALADLDGWIE